MNKKLRFSMLSVLMMLCGSMFADDVTIVAETSLTELADNTAITVEGFTFKALKNSGGIAFRFKMLMLMQLRRKHGFVMTSRHMRYI